MAMLNNQSSAAPGTFMPSLHTFLQGRQAHVRLVVSKARLGFERRASMGSSQISWEYHRYYHEKLLPWDIYYHRYCHDIIISQIYGIISDIGQTTIHNSTIWKTKFGVKHGKTTNSYVCLKMENTHSYPKIGTMMTIHWALGYRWFCCFPVSSCEGRSAPIWQELGGTRTNDEKWHTFKSNHFLFLWCSVFLTWVQWSPRIIIECSRQDVNQISFSDSMLCWVWDCLS